MITAITVNGRERARSYNETFIEAVARALARPTTLYGIVARCFCPGPTSGRGEEARKRNRRKMDPHSWSFPSTRVSYRRMDCERREADGDPTGSFQASEISRPASFADSLRAHRERASESIPNEMTDTWKFPRPDNFYPFSGNRPDGKTRAPMSDAREQRERARIRAKKCARNYYYHQYYYYYCRGKLGKKFARNALRTTASDWSYSGAKFYGFAAKIICDGSIRRIAARTRFSARV